jgi:hypothetical protein
MFKKIWNWLKSKGWKYLVFGLIGYIGHIALEAFIVTNILSKFGISIPVIV